MVEVRNIARSFGSTQAVDDLSFSIGGGEIVGLLGPNGAGKTTTMRIMSGFLSPDEGTVTVEGISILENPTEAQKIIGYLPENNPLYNEMLVSELLGVSADLKGLSRAKSTTRKKALDFVVNAVNIKDVYYHPIRELSKGYKQRVGLAVVLLHKPKILILDEPTEGLDPNQRTEIRSLIKELAQERTVIISTHVMQEVEALCSRMIIINKGKRVADGSVEELSRGTKDEKIVHAGLEGENIEEGLRKLTEVKSVDCEKKKGNLVYAKIVTPADYLVQPEISQLAKENNWVIWSLQEERRNLEDVFKELTVEIEK